MEVRLIAMTDVMCNDVPKGALFSPEQVCNFAARTCTSEDAGTMAGTWYVEDESVPVWNDLDMKSLMAAMKSGHESVLEHAVFTFEVKGVSRALTHQLVRHRIASYSQQSQRYVKITDMDGYVIPKSVDEWNMLNDYCSIMGEIWEYYDRLIKAGVPVEDARYILPNACTTNIIITMNARELRHFFSLRCCERAQWEIRELANRMLKICKEVSPIIFEWAGPRCAQLGYCPEAKGCGRMPKKEVDR